MNNYDFSYNNCDIEEERKEELIELAYNYCEDIPWENELEFLIKEMNFILEDRKKQVKEIEEIL